MKPTNTIREIVDCSPDAVANLVESETQPLLFKGLVRDWPVVQESQQSAHSALRYIQKFYSGDDVSVFVGPASIHGRIGYNEDLTGFNFEHGTASLDEFLKHLLSHVENPQPPAHYMGSTLLDRWFPGFRKENDLGLGDFSPLASLWIGNQIKVSAHFDVASNVACCVAGRRRFTLFPPDQLENLYIGPWDKTPAGQAISLVDFADPDFDAFPKFRDALESASQVTLEPGDAVYVPSMWWHHVEGLDPINLLVNYWWRLTPRFLGAPLAVLKHALLELQELPPEQRQAWRQIFDFYVFDPKAESVAHIPQHSRGMLAPMDETAARQLRADLLNQLNR